MALLEVANLHAGYGSVDVLHGIGLHVDPGEFVCVVGANTAGKSTLLRAISRLVPQSRGTVRFEGRDLMPLAAHAVPPLGIAHVPEGRHVFPRMTVEENLGLGAYAAPASEIARRRAEVEALFPRLAERRTQLAGTLSGGEQQMVAVGRALMLRPRLLILDEPSHGLAPMVVEEMYRAFAGIHAQGTAVLLVEQNVAMALSAAQRAYVLEKGRIVLEGAAAALAEDDRVRQAYLGI